MTNETINLTNVDLNRGIDYFSYLSQTITEKIIEFLAEKGITLSVRFVSLLVLFVSLLLIYVGMKISKPIIKYALIILGAIILLGTLIPSW